MDAIESLESPPTLPLSIVISVDTEYLGPHTLTLQTAARIDAQTIAVQLYRSEAIPDLPANFDQQAFLPLAHYGAFYSRLILRPTKLLSADLSPLSLVRDLYELPGVTIMSRSNGRQLIDLFEHPCFPFPITVPSNVQRGRRGNRWIVPPLLVTLVGHFLRADFGRIHGRGFLASLKHPYEFDRTRLAMRCRKLLQFVETRRHRTETQPVLGYLKHNDLLFEGRVQMRDTVLPFGSSSLEGLSRTFLQLGKCAALGHAEKANMLQTFQSRTHDAYGYAMTDAVNTLLVYEAMEKKDRQIYQAFGVAEKQIPPLRATLGSRVSTFLMATLQPVVAGSTHIASGRGLKALMVKGGLTLFRQHPQESMFGAQTGQVHGGLLYSRSPTRFWHEAPGMLRDVDMAACYNNIIAGLNVYWGRPIILEPGEKRLTLRDAVVLVQQHAERDGWIIRVSGDIRSFPNALVPSSENALVSCNYREKLGRAKRRQARQRAFQLEAHDDPAFMKGTGGSKLYAVRVEAGVITDTTWLMIQALPPRLRHEYEELTADSVIFYFRSLVAHSGPEYDRLVSQFETTELGWEGMIDLNAMELVRKQKIDAEYVALAHSIAKIAKRIGQFRADAQRTEGKGSGLDTAWKAHANTMYGVLASTYLPTNNFVAANQITAWARAEAFAMSQALNAIQTITDGCTYRCDQIPACTYRECLQKKPDYPIRRADEGDGIPFLDPDTIPHGDADFTAWYRSHVARFFEVRRAAYDELFNTHALEHKATSKTKAVAFDALACDGAGNYLKATLDGSQWLVEDFAARSYGKRAKEALKEWILRTYSSDSLTELAPVTTDCELLSFKKAAQKARAALDDGIPGVVFPLGLEHARIMYYRPLKPSAFIFDTPEQRTAVLKQWQKFEDRTGAGLEVLVLRRGYRGRRQGSLKDLAEEIFAIIRSGERNLTRALNLNKTADQLLAVAAQRKQEIATRKATADQRLHQLIDAQNLPREAWPTAYVVTADDIAQTQRDGQSMVLTEKGT